MEHSIVQYDVLEAFARGSQLYTPNIEEYEPYLYNDDSGYIYVDGEEGDYGNEKFHLLNGCEPNENNLVAVKTIYGGDSYDWEFTKFGVYELTKFLREAFEVSLTKITADI